MDWRNNDKKGKVLLRSKPQPPLAQLLPPAAMCFFIENFVYIFVVALILAKLQKQDLCL
jgi:hypothetical protein